MLLKSPPIRKAPGTGAFLGEGADLLGFEHRPLPLGRGPLPRLFAARGGGRVVPRHSHGALSLRCGVPPPVRLRRTSPSLSGGGLGFSRIAVCCSCRPWPSCPCGWRSSR